MQLVLPEEGPEEEARHRLEERLKLFCLVERKVKGACLPPPCNDGHDWGCC